MKKSVIAIIKDEQTGYFLMGKRHDYDATQPGWSFIGGKIDGEETEYEALVREVWEEIDKQVKTAYKIGEYLSRMENRADFIVSVYFVTLQNGNNSISFCKKEYSEVAWFSEESVLLQDLAGNTATALQIFLQQ